MVSVKLLSVGTLKEQYLRDAFAEYSKRLSGMCRFEAIELKETKLPESPSKAEIAAALDEEGARIVSKIPPRAYRIALCVEGVQYSSEAFAHKLESAMRETSEVVFIIGSSYGLSDSVKNACDIRLSLSQMTFPHQLTRVLTAEIIYRTFNIIKGTRYHK